MHVLSTEQFKFLLSKHDYFQQTIKEIYKNQIGVKNNKSNFTISDKKEDFNIDNMNRSKLKGTLTLLDVGAGDGNVTEKLQRTNYFEKIYTTEVSPMMVKNLNARGFNCLQTPSIGREDIKSWGVDYFDCITCLNLLDRCDKPSTLLSQMKNLLKPGKGILIIAVVFPFESFVEIGQDQKDPTEFLDPLLRDVDEECCCPTDETDCTCGAWPSFEESCQSFVDKILVPTGFKLLCISRVPYLCKGDLKSPYYVLDDAIFVVTPEESIGV